MEDLRLEIQVNSKQLIFVKQLVLCLQKKPIEDYDPTMGLFDHFKALSYPDQVNEPTV